MRIVVADDWPDTADMLAGVLALEGHEVRTAYRSDDALALAARFRPAVMIVDLTLPPDGGLELAVRARRSLDPVPALAAVTGWATELDRTRALAHGFDRHFAKPVSPEALIAWIATVAPGGD
jgi:DNA-binding response OmpR family regulator